MCDPDGGGAGAGDGSSSGDEKEREFEAAQGQFGGAQGNEPGRPGVSHDSPGEGGIGGFIKSNVHKLMVPTPIAAVISAVEKIPKEYRGAVPDTNDSKQGSSYDGAGDGAQRTVLTQAAAQKEDDARRATRGRTVLTSPRIRKPVLSKKEPLGVTGGLG